MNYAATKGVRKPFMRLVQGSTRKVALLITKSSKNGLLKNNILVILKRHVILVMAL